MLEKLRVKSEKSSNVHPNSALLDQVNTNPFKAKIDLEDQIFPHQNSQQNGGNIQEGVSKDTNPEGYSKKRLVKNDIYDFDLEEQRRSKSKKKIKGRSKSKKVKAGRSKSRHSKSKRKTHFKADMLFNKGGTRSKSKHKTKGLARGKSPNRQSKSPGRKGNKSKKKVQKKKQKSNNYTYSNDPRAKEHLERQTKATSDYAVGFNQQQSGYTRDQSHPFGSQGQNLKNQMYSPQPTQHQLVYDPRTGQPYPVTNYSSHNQADPYSKQMVMRTIIPGQGEINYNSNKQPIFSVVTERGNNLPYQGGPSRMGNDILIKDHEEGGMMMQPGMAFNQYGQGYVDPNNYSDLMKMRMQTGAPVTSFDQSRPQNQSYQLNESQNLSRSSMNYMNQTHPNPYSASSNMQPYNGFTGNHGIQQGYPQISVHRANEQNHLPQQSENATEQTPNISEKPKIANIAPEPPKQISSITITPKNEEVVKEPKDVVKSKEATPEKSKPVQASEVQKKAEDENKEKSIEDEDNKSSKSKSSSKSKKKKVVASKAVTQNDDSAQSKSEKDAKVEKLKEDSKKDSAPQKIDEIDEKLEETLSVDNDKKSVKNDLKQESQETGTVDEKSGKVQEKQSEEKNVSSKSPQASNFNSVSNASVKKLVRDSPFMKAESNTDNASNQPKKVLRSSPFQSNEPEKPQLKKPAPAVNKFKDSPFGSQASEAPLPSKLTAKQPVKAPTATTTSPFQKKVGETASPFGESKDKPANPFGAKLNPPKVESKTEAPKDEVGEDGKSINKLKGLWK